MIAPSPLPMMATTLSIENRRDNDNGRAARASIVSPPSGTFLALNNGGNAGDAVGKARGRVEEGVLQVLGVRQRHLYYRRRLHGRHDMRRAASDHSQGGGVLRSTASHPFARPSARRCTPQS